MTTTGCLATQFTDWAELDPLELELLASLERGARDYPAGSVLSEAGDELRDFFTLTRGWGAATRPLADGQRQVLDLFLPGQIMGLREIGFNQSQSRLIAVTDLTACPFPRSRLEEIFQQSPRLGLLLFRSLTIDNAVLTERIINIGRKTAIERLAHLLLELHVRLAVEGSEFDLPLNQEMIADALGLTPVHISRVLTELKGEGLVSIKNNRVRLIDLDALTALAEFDARYLGLSIEPLARSA